LAAQAGWASGNPGTDATHPFVWGCDESSSTTVEILDHGSATSKNVFPCFDIPSVPDVLPAGVDWRFYGSTFFGLTGIWTMFDAVKPVWSGPAWKTNIVNASKFDGDVPKGTSPAVTGLVSQDYAGEH